jgi:hypothetical protein
VELLKDYIYEGGSGVWSLEVSLLSMVVICVKIIKV